MKDLQNLRQPHLPRRIAIQHDPLPKMHQQIRLAHDAFFDFHIDQISAHVLRL